MIQVYFKNLKKSNLTKSIVIERISTIISKYPKIMNGKVLVTLEMENSPVKAGPDLFSVKIQIRNRMIKELILKKSASNLYIALAELVDHLPDQLARELEKSRSIQRSSLRRLIHKYSYGF